MTAPANPPAPFSPPAGEAVELLPCPFCGGTELRRNDTGVFWVSCDDCHAEGPSGDTPWQTDAAWNHRPTPAARDAAGVRGGMSGKRVQFNVDPSALFDRVQSGAYETQDEAFRTLGQDVFGMIVGLSLVARFRLDALWGVTDANVTDVSPATSTGEAGA